MAEKNNEAKSRRRLKLENIKSAVKNHELAPNKNTVKSNKLELLVTVVGRSKAEYYTDLIQSLDVNMQVTAFGSGTADAKMLVLLGLDNSEKAVIFSVIQEKKIPDALRMLDERFKTIKDGKGVAFTIPLTSVIGTLIFRFLSNTRLAVKEGT